MQSQLSDKNFRSARDTKKMESFVHPVNLSSTHSVSGTVPDAENTLVKQMGKDDQRHIVNVS